jgi:molybdopterin synthase catalytic subunit
MSAPESEPTPSDTELTLPQSISDGPIHVSLTSTPLDPTTHIKAVRSPHAGATVLFLGTTRDTFDSRPVATLAYSSYVPLALKTLHSIANAVHKNHDLTAISIVHRLGDVPVGEESIVIAVSSPHRQAAWRAGEEALEECKRRTEVWKREVFADGKGEEGGEWRANKDTAANGTVQQKGEEDTNMKLDDIPDAVLKAQVARMQVLFPSVSVYGARAALVLKKGHFDTAVDYLVGCGEHQELPRRGSMTAF